MLTFFKTFKLGIAISIIVFLVGLLTISDYGINTDEPAHFIRGQAYLKYLVTGGSNYSDIDFQGNRVSNWQFRQFDPEYFLQHDSGHPALNDILAAATNKVFYTYLGLTGDLQAYHLFEIFISSIGILFLYLLIKEHLGELAGCTAALSFALYPLFYGESHFNIKDPVSTTFFILTVYFFYLGVNKISARLFLISAFFCALGFGTKFNIMFLPFILTPYLLVRFFPVIKEKGLLVILRIPLRIILSLVVGLIIIIGIHFITRPYLWADPINRFIEIIKYYKDIGTGTFPDTRFLFHGWNMYPSFFILISTPPVILLLFCVGLVYSVVNFKKDKHKLSLLLFLWFSIPIIRVSVPGSSIYNGVRQIMEFIPAMAAFCGIGVFYLHSLIVKYINSKLAFLVIILGFMPVFYTLIRLHPNESLYMNFTIGGLKGAYDKKVPGAGESMGNVYLQGVEWLNKNAEKDAKFGLPVGLFSNIPQEFIRTDIKFGPYFSGMKQDGEYMMEKISVGFPPAHILNYNFRYLERFLIPVHEIKVDGSIVLKIWKNDQKYLKQGFTKVEEINDFSIRTSAEGYLEIDFQKLKPVVRIEIYNDNKNCTMRDYGLVTQGHVSFSPDGKKEIIFGDLMFAQGPYAMSLQTDTRFVYFLSGDEARWVRIAPSDPNLCLLKVNKIRVFIVK